MKMPLVLSCLASVLLLLLLFSPAKQGSEAVPVSCCVKTYKGRMPHRNQLLKYVIQTKPLCAVEAVRFRTKKGNIICSDPSSQWTISAKDFLDKKNNPQIKEPIRTTTHKTTSLKPEVQHNSTTTNSTVFLI